MSRDNDIYYRAVIARDARFDGKFFTGVKTTGIYCRPICPAKPKRENVIFFSSALEAEKAGFRPCLRCRPESAPHSPAWVGKSILVHRALRLISNQEFIEGNESDFASKLGVSPRHLRRLFEAELGKTPKQVSDLNRLNFARKLIVESDLPVTEIAFASGFQSLRRFNDAIKKRFYRSPRELRSQARIESSENALELSISFRPPLDWDSLLYFFERHAIRPLETIKNNSYQRDFRLDDSIGRVIVSPHPDKNLLLLSVQLENPRSLYKVMHRVRGMFDLESDPLTIESTFATFPTMKKLWSESPGIRLPRGWDPFETAIGIILGQLVSVEQASNLMEQLVVHYGEKGKGLDGKELVFFPEAKVLAKADLKEVRTTQVRKRTIREFSKRIASGELRLDSAQDPEAFREKLLNIPGIGPWTAEMIALRAIGDTNAFPESDLIINRAVKLHREWDLQKIQPWRGYAAMLLWKVYAKKLSKKRNRNDLL